jgi:hypothetical protein
MHLAALTNSTTVLFEIDDNLPIPYPVLKSTEIGLQITDEKR